MRHIITPEMKVVCCDKVMLQRFLHVSCKLFKIQVVSQVLDCHFRIAEVRIDSFH